MRHNTEKLMLKGFVKGIVYDEKIKKVCGYFESDNLIVNKGRDLTVQKLVQANGANAVIVKIGTGTVAVNATQNGLISPNSTANVPNTALNSPGTLQYTWTVASSSYTDATESVLAEMGVFENGGTNMFSRVVFTPIVKTTDMSIAFTYQIKLGTTT